jgi:hypothetical protein
MIDKTRELKPGTWYMGLSLILSLQINRNWTHQLLVYDADVTVSGDTNYNKEKQKSSIRCN